MCVDFRELNKVTIEHKYPIPTIKQVVRWVEWLCFFFLGLIWNLGPIKQGQGKKKYTAA